MTTPKTKIGYLLRYLSQLPECKTTKSNSSDSYYFSIDKVLIRVSDHYGSRNSCDLYIMLVDNKYQVCISKNGSPIVFNSLSELKNFITTYLLICKTLNKSALSHETEYMNTLILQKMELELKVQDLQSQINSMETKLNAFNVKKCEIISHIEEFITSLKDGQFHSTVYPFVLFLMSNHNNRYQALSTVQFPMIQKIYETVSNEVFISFINQLATYSKERRQVFIEKFAKENHVTLTSS